MKTVKRMFLGTLIGSCLVLGSALAGSESPSTWHYAPSLVGTWQFEMTVRNNAPDCTTSEPIAFGPNPFPALISYHEGGTLNEFASRTSPAVRSTGFGSWKQTGSNRYKERHTFMEFDPNGLLWRTMVIESNIRLSKNGNAYDAVMRLELTDISGNVVNFCATAEAVRFKP
jgi:hypothetical protein